MNVLITGKLHPSVIQKIESNKNIKLIYRPDVSLDKIEAELKQAEVLISRSETDINQEVIDLAKNLKFVIRAAVGIGNIDVHYATEKGILVMNCPGQNTNSAAEHTMGLLLSVIRKISAANDKMKSGGWDRHQFNGEELKGKKLGLVGLGNVGHRVARFANSFDMQVYAYDPYVSPEVFKRHQCTHMTSLEDMLKEIDILSVHVPLNDETSNMIDSNRLKLLKKGSYVVNAARGGIINEAALLEQLNDQSIAGAGIDTWESEPKPNSKLVLHPNVVCSPHIGASTEQAQIAIGETVYTQLIKAMRGEVVDYPVNLPNVGLIQNPLIQAYGVLAEKLGKICSHVLQFNPQQINFYFRGEISTLDPSLIKLGFAKGFLHNRIDGYVSFVNALDKLKKIGVTTHDTMDTEFTSYRSAIKIVVSGGNDRLSIGGTVFDNCIQRLSLIDMFHFELEPVGNFIIITNNDQPGVVGDIGTYLAHQKVNIDTFDLSRNKLGGKAMAFIKVDQMISQDQVEGLKKLKNILSVKTISL